MIAQARGGARAIEAGCLQLREEWGLRQSLSNPLPLSAKQVRHRLKFGHLRVHRA